MIIRHRPPTLPPSLPPSLPHDGPIFHLELELLGGQVGVEALGPGGHIPPFQTKGREGGECRALRRKERGKEGGREGGRGGSMVRTVAPLQ